MNCEETLRLARVRADLNAPMGEMAGTSGDLARFPELLT